MARKLRRRLAPFLLRMPPDQQAEVYALIAASKRFEAIAMVRKGTWQPISDCRDWVDDRLAGIDEFGPVCDVPDKPPADRRPLL